jgi:2-dehydropantoate 2-reductase
MNKTEVLLIGTGAVGSYFGGKLALADVRISALCRSDYDIVKERGIDVRSYKGDFCFKPAEVVNDLARLSAQPEYVLICLKALPEVKVADLIRAVVKPETVIVLVQNGIDIELEVARQFPDNELISGIAFIAVSRLALGVVRHTGSGKLILGNYPQGVSPKTEKLATLFQSVQVPCDLSRKITRDRWQKMIWNAAFNPISVLGGKADSRQMVDVPEAEQLVRNVMKEVMSLAAATGNELPDEVMENAILGNRKMHPFKTSMLVDHESGRSMEIDAILGNAIAIAQKYGKTVPYLESLFSLMKLQAAVLKGNTAKP